MNYERARSMRGTPEEEMRDIQWQDLLEKPGATIEDACNLWMREDAPFVPIGSDFPYHYIHDYGVVVKVPVSQKISCFVHLDLLPVATKFEIVNFRKALWGFNYRRLPGRAMYREYRWVRD